MKIQIVCYCSQENGQIVLILNKEMAEEQSFDNILLKEEMQFVFSKVTYDKLNTYKSRSMIYNQEDRTNTINQLKLRQYFLIYHLVDWNLKDEEGNKIELKFDPNGTLSDESLQLIYTMPANLLDLVLSTYEKRMNIF